jgi:hypothetical protein
MRGCSICWSQCEDPKKEMLERTTVTANGRAANNLHGWDVVSHHHHRDRPVHGDLVRRRGQTRAGNVLPVYDSM